MMNNLALNYEPCGPVDDGFLSYHSGAQKEAESLVSSAHNNLSNYHSEIMGALSAEEKAEDTFNSQIERYEEAESHAGAILDELGQEIKSLRSEIQGMEAKGASSATIAEYKIQLADAMGDVAEVRQTIGYMAEDLQKAHDTYSETVAMKEQAYNNLAQARDSYSAANDNADFIKQPSDLGKLISKSGTAKEVDGLAKVLQFRN